MEAALYPADQTFQLQRAFEKAEAAWIGWRRSPLGDEAYENHGVALLQAFLDAGAAYLEYARQQTGVRRHDPTRYVRETGLLAEGRAEWDADLNVPAFLRRREWY